MLICVNHKLNAMKRRSKYTTEIREKMVGANLHEGYIEAVLEL